MYNLFTALCTFALFLSALCNPSSSPDLAIVHRELARRELARQLAAAHPLSPLVRDGHGVNGQIPRQLIGGGSSYAPYKVACPTDWTWVRSATIGIGVGEQAYLKQRNALISAPINAMLAAHNITSPPRTPVIGFALSGGGYRAMINGLGGVMATMNASSEAAASGIGGWFDGVTYMAGLSGGSWATGSLVANGGPLPTELVSNVWNLDSNLVIPDDDTVSFYYDLVSEVDAKSNAGFPVQITDYWALALGDHLLPVQYRLNTSPNITFDQLLSVVPQLANASLPMPILIAAEREPGQTIIAENATVWEFTPFEFGSWSVGATNKVPGMFTSIEYLGSPIDNNTANGTCWKGFDQMSFVMGTSSTLFNYAIVQLNGTTDNILTDAIESILNDLGEAQADVSRIPNTFYNYTAQENPLSSYQYLTLVDAGETNQNIPIEPLLIPERALDAIIAFDNSADTTYSWPNGTALYTTYNRAQALAQQQNVTLRMPAVPSANGFINGGLNTRPTFFGCNVTDSPLIIYVPNYPWSAVSNTSTFQLQYDNSSALTQMTSVMRAFTLNGTVPTWPACLACALTDRAFDYTSANRTATCQSCFDTWCWDGVDNSTAPSGNYAPVVGTTPTFLVEKNLTTSPSTADNTTTTQSVSMSSLRWDLNSVTAMGAALVGCTILVL